MWFPPNPTKSNPIFIIGVHRSGTTLLRFMLSSHPNIYIPPESDFIPRFFLRYPQRELSSSDIRRYLDIIFRQYRFVEDWKGKPPDPVDFVHLLNGHRTPATFLDLLYRLYAHQNNAVRWGDKTPIYTSYVDLLHTIFPDAQFIHMIRDPRDLALSMVEHYRGREFHVDIYFAAKNWLRRTLKARQDGAVLGNNQYLEIFYEDLVNQPEQNLVKISNFIGEDFAPEMKAQHIMAQEIIPDDSHFFKNVRLPVNTNSVYRWKKELSQADLATVQIITGPLMEELGYPLADVKEPNLSETARQFYYATKYSVLQVGRRLLQTINLVPPI